jgi:GxxExxY protein
VRKSIRSAIADISCADSGWTFVVAGRILLEIKAVDCLAPVHLAQVMCYLRVSALRVALLMNFNSAVLQDRLKRIVL